MELAAHKTDANVSFMDITSVWEGGYLVCQCLNVGTVKTVVYKVDRPLEPGSKSTRQCY